MVCIVISSSLHATQDFGPLRRAGLFSNAMNFLTPHNQLLALHRNGFGLSPMGWVIDESDFDLIALTLASAEQLRFDAQGMWFDTLLLKNPGPGRRLTLAQRGLVTSGPVRQALFCSPVQTGLFGQLDTLVGLPATGELLALQSAFTDWLHGASIDWSAFIGKGPGLTPSNDDTLTGMLLVAHADSRINPTRLAPFFATSKPLAGLTTLISHHYLTYAQQGIFATPLLELAAGLLAPQALLPAVQRLLNIGHYSGADTLLGVWLATQVINQQQDLGASLRPAASSLF